MKKRICIMGICIVTMLSMLLTGCTGDIPYSDLDLSQYLKVGKYKGIETEPVSVSVEKSDIADKINEDLDAATTETQLKKGDLVEDGDAVNISYVGKVDGKTFDGGTAKKQDLEIGSGSLIDGFETGLVGHEVGEKNIVLNLAFPLDYKTEELQGKDVVFTVKINSATRNVKPEYNDEFVQSLGDYKTTAEFEKAVKKSLYKEKKEEAVSEQKKGIWSEALSNTKVKKYPKDVVEGYMETFDAQIDYYAEQYSTDRATIMAQYYGAASEASLKKQLKDYARTLVKQEMLIEYIAQKEDITYTDKEAETLQENIEAQGYDEDAVLRETGRDMEAYVHIELLYEKVMDFLLDNAKMQ